MNCRGECDWAPIDDAGGRYAVCGRCGALGKLVGVRMYGNNPDSYADGETYEALDMYQVALALYHAEDAADASRIVQEYLDCLSG